MNRTWKHLFFITGMCLSVSAFAQTKGLGTWNVLSGKYIFNEKWSVFAEAQVRSQQTAYDFSYYEYKGGVAYNFPKNFSVLLGMGHYRTFQPVGNFNGPVVGNEFRIWQQFGLINNIDKLKLEHRYRIEQRFTIDGFHSRFRYRLNALLPLNGRTITAKTWYANAAVEVFILDKAPHFEQNRLFAGFGYQFNDKVTLQSGLMHRFDQTSNFTSFSKNYIQTSLMFSFNEFKTGREKQPSAID